MTGYFYFRVQSVIIFSQLRHNPVQARSKKYLNLCLIRIVLPFLRFFLLSAPSCHVFRILRIACTREAARTASGAAPASCQQARQYEKCT